MTESNETSRVTLQRVVDAEETRLERVSIPADDPITTVRGGESHPGVVKLDMPIDVAMGADSPGIWDWGTKVAPPSPGFVAWVREQGKRAAEGVAAIESRMREWRAEWEAKSEEERAAADLKAGLDRMHEVWVSISPAYPAEARAELEATLRRHGRIP